MQYLRELFLIVLLFLFYHSFSQVVLPSDTDRHAVLIDTLKTIQVDSSLLPLPDSTTILKKEIRSEKIRKVIKLFSYIKYNDTGYGKEFGGEERYNPYKGKKIRSIQIDIFKPFGTIDEDGNQQISKKGQKIGNKIHFISKEWYVKNDILFKEGDIVDPTLFADTEKLLWDRKKFKDIRILLTEDSTTNDVDVLIYLQDNLSWIIGLGYNDRLIFGVSTYNFFGLPNTLSVFAGINFNKKNLWAFGGEYKYENIQGSQINFTTNFVVERLNQNVFLSLNRKFFSKKAQWAFDLKYVYDNNTRSLTKKIIDTLSYIKTKSHTYSLWLAYSLPFNRIISIRDDKLKLVFATRMDYTDYKKRPFLTNQNYDRIFVKQQNYMFGIGVARWDYYLARNSFYIDVAEYFPRGYSASFWLGPQIDEVYGKRFSFDLTVNYGVHFKRFGYLYPQVNFSGYVRNKKGEEMVSKFSLDYVSNKVKLAKVVYFRQILKFGSNVGIAMPEERYFNINGTNGVRGFYSPSLKGSKSFMFNAECDLFFDKKIALTKAMTYIFCDAAWLSKNNQSLFTQSVFQYGIGFGLRLRAVDFGLPYLDLQFTFYPRGKDFGDNLFQFRLNGSNPNAIQQNNMLAE